MVISMFYSQILFINWFSSFRNVTQTHDYVMFFLNLLFDHGVFDNFEALKIWSDGCGKHFKTYPIHYYMATLKKKVCIFLKFTSFLIF